MSAWFGFCLMEKLVLMSLVNCLLTAKTLFDQSCLHNSMSESNYVTQWKFLKRCSAGHWSYSYSHRRNEMSAIYVPLVIGWRRGVWRRCWGQEVNSPPPMTSVTFNPLASLCGVHWTDNCRGQLTDWVTGSEWLGELPDIDLQASASECVCAGTTQQYQCTVHQRPVDFSARRYCIAHSHSIPVYFIYLFAQTRQS